MSTTPVVPVWLHNLVVNHICPATNVVSTAWELGAVKAMEAFAMRVIDAYVNTASEGWRPKTQSSESVTIKVCHTKCSKHGGTWTTTDYSQFDRVVCDECEAQKMTPAELLEECAKLAEPRCDPSHDSPWEKGYWAAQNTIAHDIRALKNAVLQVPGRGASTGADGEGAVSLSSTGEPLSPHSPIAIPASTAAQDRAIDKWQPVTYCLIAPGCETGPCESLESVALARALTMPTGTAVVPLYRSAPSSDRETYWLIERGSPCEWWVRGSGKGDGTMLQEEWTTDASKAFRFNEWGAKQHAEELMKWGVKGPLRATEHIDCAGPELQQSASGAFLTDVCEALFGCFVAPGYNDDHERIFTCSVCDERIDIAEWVLSKHADDCLINRVRDYLAEHRPESCAPYVVFPPKT